MALTLSKGFIKPQDGDPGSVWFDALETNVQKVNDHTHNGTDSQALTGAAIVAQTLNFALADWGSPTDGLYSQTKTIPGSLTYDNTVKEARLSNGDVVNADMIKASATTITVRTNDNSQDINVAFK